MCYLDGESLVDSRKDTVFVAYTYLLTESAQRNCQVSTFAVLRLIAYQFLQDAYCSRVTIICSSTAAVCLLCVLYRKGAQLFF